MEAKCFWVAARIANISSNLTIHCYFRMWISVYSGGSCNVRIKPPRIYFSNLHNRMRRACPIFSNKSISRSFLSFWDSLEISTYQRSDLLHARLSHIHGNQWIFWPYHRPSNPFVHSYRASHNTHRDRTGWFNPSTILLTYAHRSSTLVYLSDLALSQYPPLWIC